MCPSAGYTGRQELNIAQFINPPGVQAARREGESNSHEKEGDAALFKKCKQISATA